MYGVWSVRVAVALLVLFAGASSRVVYEKVGSPEVRGEE